MPPDSIRRFCREKGQSAATPSLPILDRHLGQDPATWKLLSFLTWGPCTASDLALYRGSWRAMFVARPRPRTDGAYIFKWNTVKYGTNEGRGTKDVGKDYYKPVSILCMLRIFIFCERPTLLPALSHPETDPKGSQQPRSARQMPMA